jgi:lipopolysaccharide transport system ATP-binding protein
MDNAQTGVTAVRTENALEVRGLSKLFFIPQEKSSTLKELAIQRFFRRSAVEELWALRQVSFEVRRGEAFGIIGGNGSGKSTLLKLIAGVMEPTEGSIVVQGSIGSLLELGTGFHPEFSGLENIYLNGAVLGMKKSDIDRIVGDIVRFAELEQFIHTPLKHYSSGMYVRLAFSIAINLDPDILVIDEVLSVGDNYFQAKSFDRIRSFKERGKTIVFVTHNLEQVEMLCDRALWLDNGEVRALGPASEVTTRYISRSSEHLLAQSPMQFDLRYSNWTSQSRVGSGEALVDRVVLRNRRGEETRRFRADDTLTVEIHYHAVKPLESMDCYIGLSTEDNLPITLINALSQGADFRSVPRRGKIVARFDPLLLSEGRYCLSFAINPKGEPLMPYDSHMRLHHITVSGEGRQPPPCLSARQVRTAIQLPVTFELKPATEDKS